MELSPTLIAQATGAHFQRAIQCAPGLNQAMQAFDINTPARAGMFLANIGHETMGLQFLSEIWGPTAQQLRYERDFTQPWPKCPADARRPEFHRNALAYALGNTELGDGRKFPGHGMLQTTGRFNHAKTRDRLRARFPGRDIPDFEEQPHLLADPVWAALSAGDYVEMKGCNAAADAGDFDAYCDLINLGRHTVAEGDSNGYAQRLALWQGIDEGGVFA